MELELTIYSASGEQVHEISSLVQAVIDAEIAMNQGAFYTSVKRKGADKPDIEQWSDAVAFPIARA